MSETVENADAEAPEGADAPADNTPSVEDRARTLGWRPKEEFKGDESRWIDAETFVRRGEDVLPILKANNRQMEKALAARDSELSKVKATLERFAEHHNKTEQRAYERALRELKGDIAQAAAAGDVQGVLDKTEELSELQAEAKAKPAAQDAPQEPPEFTAWKADNPWFGKDKALTAATAALGEELVGEGYTGAALIKEVDKRLRAEFPNKFENPARRQAATVEGGGAPPRKAGKTYSDLPPDAKAACDDFVKRVPGFTREKYVKDFFQ